MTAPFCPPETYQQWLDSLRHLKEHSGDKEMLLAVARGTFSGQPPESFLARLSDAVSDMLSWHCRRFLTQLDQALAEGEPDMGRLLAIRLRRNVQDCLFYRRLPFLESGYVKTLDEGFERQLQAFWASFLQQLRLTARDSADPGMEDLVRELSRVKIV